MFQATQSMRLDGSVLSPSRSNGRGSSIDIAAPLDFVISGGSTAEDRGSWRWNAAVLNGFGAGSLVIGGKRARTTAGTTLEVMATSVTVDNPGVPVSAADLTLAAQGNLSVGPGSVLRSSGRRPEAESYLVSGNGTLVRLSEDLGATVIRTGVTPGGSPTLTVGAGARLSGASLTLDSMSQTVLDPGAVLDARAYALNTGRISLLLDNPGTLQPDPGLVLTGSLLDNLRSVDSLSLVSYTSIDFYGSGLLDGVKNLALNAGESGLQPGWRDGGSRFKRSAARQFLRRAAPAVPAPATGDLSSSPTPSGWEPTSSPSTNSDPRDCAPPRGSSERDRWPFRPGFPGLDDALAHRQRGIQPVHRQRRRPVPPRLRRSPVRSRSLGASLNLTGRSVTIGTTVALPSGTLSVRATQGDLTVNGTLDVGGTSRLFYDFTRTRTEERCGSPRTKATCPDRRQRVDVSAHPGGGNAGDLRVSASQARFRPRAPCAAAAVPEEGTGDSRWMSPRFLAREDSAPSCQTPP